MGFDRFGKPDLIPAVSSLSNYQLLIVKFTPRQVIWLQLKKWRSEHELPQYDINPIRWWVDSRSMTFKLLYDIHDPPAALLNILFGPLVFIFLCPFVLLAHTVLRLILLLHLPVLLSCVLLLRRLLTLLFLTVPPSAVVRMDMGRRRPDGDEP